jgi:transcriptional repressor NrdR
MRRERRNRDRDPPRPVAYPCAVHCPMCRADDTKVVDSRLADEGAAVRRRRRCPSCGHRFTTFERVDEVPLTVVKSSGSTEPFDRGKIARGLEAATKGRGLDVAQIERIAESVEDSVRLAGSETTSARIGVLVLEQLGAVDEVAYLRFASVYKNFDAAADFHREIELLTKGQESRLGGAPGE